MKIAFRTDASASLGTGHVMRCLALAEALKAKRAEIGFVCRELPAHYASLIRKAGYALATGDEAEVGACDWLVVDHYALGADWERQQRGRAAKIMVIDDLANRPHDCDLLLDQNVLSAGNPYQGRVPAGSRVYLGPRYALLRHAFAEERSRAAPRSGAMQRVFVSFGGSDPRNHTAAALEALRPYAKQLERIDVVIGPASPFADDIAARCRTLPQAELHRGTHELPAMLARADLAIGAGGTMAWERACMGAPTLAFGIAANQVPVLEGLFQAGCAAGESWMPEPDAGRIAAWVSVAVHSPTLLRAMGARSAELVDGHGTRRIADALVPEPILFRRATIQDAADILRWRNDPRVRSGSLDAGEIDAQGHAAWMRRVLADRARVLLIAESGGRAVGVVRFDLDGKGATISVYRAAEAMEGSRGLIRAATEWLRANHPEIAQVSAEILADNAGSLAAFRKAGYSDWKGVLRYDMAKGE